MSTVKIRYFLLSFVAVFGVIVLTPFILPLQVGYRIISKDYSLIYYFKSIFYGLGIVIASTLLGRWSSPMFKYKYKFVSYFHVQAIAWDCLGGSITHGSLFHTISALVGKIASDSNSNWFNINLVLERLIDFFFGFNHCYEQALDEGLIHGYR